MNKELISLFYNWHALLKNCTSTHRIDILIWHLQLLQYLPNMFGYSLWFIRNIVFKTCPNFAEKKQTSHVSPWTTKLPEVIHVWGHVNKKNKKIMEHRSQIKNIYLEKKIKKNAYTFFFVAFRCMEKSCCLMTFVAHFIYLYYSQYSDYMRIQWL